MSTTTSGPGMPPHGGEGSPRAAGGGVSGSASGAAGAVAVAVSPVRAADAEAVERLGRIRAELAELAGLDWAGAPGQVLLDGLRGLDQVARPFEAVRAKVTAAAEIDRANAGRAGFRNPYSGDVLDRAVSYLQATGRGRADIRL